MPRRIPDYPDAYAGWNLVSSYGSYITALGMLVFFYVLLRVFVIGRVEVSRQSLGCWCHDTGVDGFFTAAVPHLRGPALYGCFLGFVRALIGEPGKRRHDDRYEHDSLCWCGAA